MPNQDPILNLLRELAAADPHIRAAALSGSRTNPNAVTDAFSDYDVVFFTDDLPASRQENFPALLERTLGPLLILQCPDEMDDGAASAGRYYTYLCQFERSRIDLRLMAREQAGWYFSTEPGLTPLLDKDRLLNGLTAIGPEVFAIIPPDLRAFENCCNEFYWTALYVVKGLCRDQLDYAAWHLDRCVREELIRMIAYRRCLTEAAPVALGAGNKYLPRLLSPEEYAEFTKTYALGSRRDCARALLLALRLFQRCSQAVAERLNVPLPGYCLRVQGACLRLLAEYHIL